MHVLIIGLGAAGSMAAWRLSRAGHQVTAFEQFHLDHDLGSSYGESRIIRRVYPDPMYTELMSEAYDLWDELQAEWRCACPTGEEADEAELLRQCGGIFFGPEGHPDMMAAEAALVRNEVSFEKLHPLSVSKRYPAFHIGAGEVALFEPSMGYVRASQAVRAATALARSAGAKLIENAHVHSVETCGSGVQVVLSNGERFDGDRAVVTAGPWTAKLLADFPVTVPLNVTRQVYIHLAPKEGSTEMFGADRFPCWIDAGANIYGFPHIGAVPGVKIASHDQGTATDPDQVARELTTGDAGGLLTYASAHFPELIQNILHAKVCLYTNSSDQDFVMDTVPAVPGASVISACSGHGFKFAPLIGQIAAEMAVGGDKLRDLARFRLSRLQ